jgi:RNA-directed DNA polymerase
MGVVRRTVTDDRVLGLLAAILRSGEAIPGGVGPAVYDPRDVAPLFAPLRPRGLPIGNLTSQFLANVLLDVLDHAILERIGCRGYVRYCDDLLVFDDDRARLHATLRAIERVLLDLRLELHPNKTFVQPTRIGIAFLGYRVLPSGVRLLPASVSRANARLRAQRRALDAGRASRDGVRASIGAWAAHTRHANATAVRALLLRRHRLTRLAP